MRICDMKEGEIKVGLRIKSLAKPRNGTIVKIEDKRGIPYALILWDDEDKPYSGFFGNDCVCEVILEGET